MRPDVKVRIPYTIRYILATCLAAAGCALWVGCASSVTVYGFEDKMLAEADSLFRIGNYEYAKTKYSKIRDNNPKSTQAAKAQYSLAYVNIYYDNPFADYNASLREFKRFATMYPTDTRIDMVNNWIRILTILQDFSKNFYGSSSQLRSLQNKQSTIFNDYSTIQDAYLRCDKSKDSLIQRIMILEGIIAEIDKIR
jgi:outer membrane protein assembly factor BamD (BamD/ComL family)